jgi:hypothetical protein
MPKQTAEPHDQIAVEAVLKEKGLGHIRVRRRADALTLESGPDKDPWPHARLRRVGGALWQLYMPTRSRYQATPFCATRDELLEMLLADFGWVLAPRE